MKKIKDSVLPLCLLFMLNSCEKVVELELPAHEPSLVVNAVINPDSLFAVDVSSSRNPFSSGAYEQVDNATVQVYQGGRLLYTLQHVVNGKYSTDLKLQHYELKVVAPGFPSAGATTHIPTAPAIGNLKATTAAPTEWEGPTVNATFTLSDTPGQENFYYIQAFTPDTSHLNGQPYRRSVGMGLAAPFEEEFTMEDRYFFSDRLFEGKAVTLRLHLENSPEHTTYVRIAHITREYYEYVRTLSKQSYRDNFATLPGPVTNNVAGGLGLFSGYNAVTLPIRP